MAKALYSVQVMGAAGRNIILLFIGDGRIAGIDVATGKYRGTTESLPNGGLRAELDLTVAPGTPLITGAAAPAGVSTIPIKFELPPDFGQGSSTVAISTPVGQVNARFEKLIDLG
jgi:hypothetical protein